ncbi:hypothetical protein BASA50_010308 [Batrachochytrium salamandrivorans]|uniref:Uncharacterized protein n=1 Tax=Batrachochytrium salamandrivorans TaxID=1357716 RepID=A0ABQ8F1L8_9FUNG|nr:hypothetical protein BASA62_007629 [Batrachochytrium salamandrivorans]KAH6589024.1 hypothetical protein BASA50_010308 [Batrachochytrium salamandrivorans]KAH6593598.1 hypothetical protein BASA61_004247 [Batrachochytrium salamandrivorans]KAH9263908.1 hypothetical protein BASA83_012652 [Batrachochytrium salamandrivorans]
MGHILSTISQHRQSSNSILSTTHRDWTQQQVLQQLISQDDPSSNNNETNNNSETSNNNETSNNETSRFLCCSLILTTQMLLISTAVLISLCLAIAVPMLYYVYIPGRIHSALNHNNNAVTDTDSASVSLSYIVIDSLASTSSMAEEKGRSEEFATAFASIDMSVSLTITLKDPPPLDMRMHSSLLTLAAINHKEDMASPLHLLKLAQIVLPDIYLPKNTAAVNVSYSTTINQINSAWVEHMLHRMMRLMHSTTTTGTTTPITADMTTNASLNKSSQVSDIISGLDYVADALPRFDVLHLGSWEVPFHQTGPLFPKSSAGDSPLLNFTFDDPSVEIVPAPSGKPQYVIQTHIGFSNPYAVALAPHDLSLAVGVYSGLVHLLDVFLPGPIAVAMGRNTNIPVRVVTDPDNTGLLMEIVGKVSDGQSALLTFRDARCTGTQCAAWMGLLLDLVWVDHLVHSDDIPQFWTALSREFYFSSLSL